MTPIPMSPNEETRLVAARATAKVLIEEAEIEGDLDDIAADVAKYCRYGDGFQMAKALERAYWDCDMRVAEVLDSHSLRLDRAHEQYLAQFQKEHDIQPPLPVGAAVKTRHGTGVIASIYEHRPLTYAIKINGDPECDGPTWKRFLVYFDEVEAA